MRAKTAEDRALLELIDPVAESLGLAVVRVRLMGGTLRRRLQIMAERQTDHDISVEECARLSRAVSEVLDAADPIAGEYLLEVSSPGIDRPLVRASDFERWAGHLAKIDTSEPVAGRKRFRGILRGAAGQDALLTRDDAKSEEERDVAIPMRAIAEARLVLTDALITEALRRGKSGLPPEMPAAEEIASPKKGRGKSLGPRPTKAGKTPQDNHEEE